MSITHSENYQNLAQMGLCLSEKGCDEQKEQGAFWEVVKGEVDEHYGMHKGSGALLMLPLDERGNRLELLEGAFGQRIVYWPVKEGLGKARLGKERLEIVWFEKMLHRNQELGVLVTRAMNLQGRIVVLKLLPRKKNRRPQELTTNAKIAAFSQSCRYFTCGQLIPKIKTPKGALYSGLLFLLREQGDLAAYWEGLSKAAQKEFIKIGGPDAPLLQMAKAVDYLHRNGWVHCDIKPQNFLVDREGRITLADFGLSKVVGEKVVDGCGTVGYVDPIYFTKPPAQQRRLSRKTDVWSLGITMSRFVNGDAFFNWTGQSNRDLDKLADMDEKAFEWWKSTKFFRSSEDRDSLDFVTTQCLRLNPKKRIAAYQVVRLMKRMYRPINSLSSAASSSYASSAPSPDLLLN